MSARAPAKPKRTAIQLFDALSPRKTKLDAQAIHQVRALLMLLDRQPPDGGGIRILPCDYAERVLELDGSTIRQRMADAVRLGCITAVLIVISESIVDPMECYIVADYGRQPDLFWHSAPIFRMLRQARERCFAPSPRGEGSGSDFKAESFTDSALSPPSTGGVAAEVLVA